MTMALQPFLDHFDNVRKVGKNYTARCPAHEDTSRNTLHIAVRPDDGARLVICRTRICDINAILGKARLKASDLFDDDGRPLSGAPRRPRAAPLPADDTTWTPAQLDAYQRSCALELLRRAREHQRAAEILSGFAQAVKRGERWVRDVRAQVIALGPADPRAWEADDFSVDDERAWALAAAAAEVEREVFQREAAQDAAAMELRRA